MAKEPVPSRAQLDPGDELAAAERSWQAHEEERRRMSDRRIRAVWHYVDAGHSLGQAARLMSDAGGKSISPSHVNKLLGCGYPEPSA